ncbi:unnamed protein product [Rhizophagus irregularis]|uniref:Uncharacterized protein n=1 Tax=Rhizophagus irregularis TaxID=588596 RepID=A0A915ZPC7_9GLOM|nr:unnamed protein product [Rhizophagus irregularis]CAB5165014.1 unnamed protein product [Rhizophagus irregularis]CAB5382004.1 unnamed protein product [Rhizophagus irregularis]
MSSNNSHVQFSDVRTFHTTPTYYNSLYNPNNFPVVYDANHVMVSPQLTIHPFNFFYRPPNELYHYNIKCNEISYSNVIFLLNKSLNSKEFNTQSNENEYIFFYQQEYDNRFYQVTCEIVSPSSITNYLNENIYGIKPQQEQQEERLSFIIEQKQNLEFHLTQYLRNYLLN